MKKEPELYFNNAPMKLCEGKRAYAKLASPLEQNVLKK